MNNIHARIRELAKSIRIQNLFVASKEVHGVHLFRNMIDFSKLQEIYLSYLYMYNAINRDIIIDKISKHVFDCELYEDAYMLWKQKKPKKNIKETKSRELNCVVTNKIKFPPKEIN
jgi:hypothetical protein